MDNRYKKVFDITYKGKKFTIFVDKYHRFTFLGKNSKGEYIYPTIEDYNTLHQIYNKQDPFVMHSVKEYTFKEKPKEGPLPVEKIEEETPNLETTEKIEIDNWELEVGEEEVVVSEPTADPRKIAIKSLDELDEILNISSVSLEDIENAINTNDKLDEHFKILARNLAVAIYENSPDADLRVYYYNLKSLESEAMSEEEYHKKFQDYSGATYNSKENKFYYKEGSSEETIYHEIAHTVLSFTIEVDNQVYYRRTSSFSALDEAFTNKIVNFVMPTHTYENIGTVLDYLRTFTAYDFNRYNEEGPGYILYDIQKQYPNIDVFYINDCLNSMKTSSIYFGENIKIEDSQELLDELFYLCKEKVNTDRTDIYKPFLDFANLFPDNEELFNQYFNEYNAYLETLQLDVISTEELETMIAPYENVQGFLWEDDILYPFVDFEIETRHDIIIQDGEEKERVRVGGLYFPANTFVFDLKKEILKNINLELNSEFWKSFVVQNNYIDASYIYKTKITLNGNSLTEDYLENVKLQIGLTSQNTIGFILQNQKQEILYQSEENLRYCSNFTAISSYYPVTFENVSELELTDILNTEYLLETQRKNKLFHNLFVEEENEFRLEPYYWMQLTVEKLGTYGISLNRCEIINSEEDFNVNGNILMKLELSLEEPLYLKDVLNYYGLLDENQSEYYFTDKEIKELVNNYLKEMNYTQTR